MRTMADRVVQTQQRPRRLLNVQGAAVKPNHPTSQRQHQQNLMNSSQEIGRGRNNFFTSSQNVAASMDLVEKRPPVLTSEGYSMKDSK